MKKYRERIFWIAVLLVSVYCGAQYSVELVSVKADLAATRQELATSRQEASKLKEKVQYTESKVITLQAGLATSYDLLSREIRKQNLLKQKDASGPRQYFAKERDDG